MLIAFDVEIDGKAVQVQATTTAWNLINAAHAIKARHGLVDGHA